MVRRLVGNQHDKSECIRNERKLLLQSLHADTMGNLRNNKNTFSTLQGLVIRMAVNPLVSALNVLFKYSFKALIFQRNENEFSPAKKNRKFQINVDELSCSDAAPNDFHFHFPHLNNKSC